MPGKIQVIVGGQFGSEGKGHAAAELAAREGEMLAIRTGGPNAGHTAYGLPRYPTSPRQDPGRKVAFKLRQLPVAGVVNPRATIAIAPRGLVQMDLLEAELQQVVPRSPVLVDPAATLLEHAHIAVEQSDESLAWGSTRKGIGAARADRIHRTAKTVQDLIDWPAQMAVYPVLGEALRYLNQGHTVQIEAAQGYGLGLHTSFYPKTTSADCRAIDALADVGLNPWALPDTALEVWVVVRPYPIRVAGKSGPLLNETSWEALELPEERTTVTNKVRRVGGWDPGLVREAVRANGPQGVRLWLNMADHEFPFLAGVTDLGQLDKPERAEVHRWLATVMTETGAPVHALGTGPDTAIFLGGY
jgi:adenylosuccinate synthase